MKFLHLFNKSSAAGFAKIQGYVDINDIVRHALDSNENYNLLFVGPSASSKTLFLQGILDMKSGVYFDGSNTTNRILDVLQERRPKIICIDELDKMPRQFLNQLLNFMESGTVKVINSVSNTILRLRVLKYLRQRMRLIGYQSHYNQGSGSSS